jgi:hypothetical protein
MKIEVGRHTTQTIGFFVFQISKIFLVKGGDTDNLTAHQSTHMKSRRPFILGINAVIQSLVGAKDFVTKRPGLG